MRQTGKTTWQGKKYRIFVFCTVCMLCVCLSVTTVASVVHTQESTGAYDSVYVAGNPSLYPVEYYDPNTQKYCGVIPEILEQISEMTGIDFTYVESGNQDRRAELFRNGQVDMISCYCSGDFEADSARKQVVLRIPREDETCEVSFIFSAPAGEDTVQSVLSALEGISQQDIMEKTISHVTVFPKKSDFDFMRSREVWELAFGILLYILLIIIFIRFLIRSEKNKRTDSETGIGNLFFFKDRYAGLMKRQPWRISCVVYLTFDTDRIRCDFGSEEARQVLMYAASVLTKIKRKEDILARVSDAGFALACFFPNRDEACEWISDLIDNLNCYSSRTKGCYPQFCAGVYFVHPSDCSPELSLDYALQGYEAAGKANKKVVVSNDKVILQNQRQNKMIRGIELAFEQDEFCVYLQFIVDAKTEKVYGGEVLSRWKHPEYGLLSPTQYIDMMIRTNTIKQLDLKVFECTCKLLADLKKEGLSDISLSCNFSCATLCGDTCLEQMDAIASEYDFDRSLLIVEFSEYDCNQDKDILYTRIAGIKARGYRILMDRFGSDSVSLFSLCRYPVDIIKLGREIFDEKTEDSVEAFLRELIDFLHGSGKTVVCEGIENEQQKILLQKTGCDLLQGYYFNHPSPLAEAGRILGER